MQDYEFFASCLSGFERLLAAELESLGIRRVRPLSGGVAFFGTPLDGERACLWSRLASRVTAVIGRVDASDADAFYRDALGLPWASALAPGATISVRAYGTNEALRNTQFTARRLKDALCDALRLARGDRPTVDAARPDAAFEVRLRNARATVSLDLAGASLHARANGCDRDAALECAYAAGLLAFASWGDLAAQGWGFVDPIHSDSALAAEAEAVACDIAPGLGRHRWGFLGWGLHDGAAWDAVAAQARRRAKEGRAARASSAAGGRQAPVLVASAFAPDAALDARYAAVIESYCAACSAAPIGSRFAIAGSPEAIDRFSGTPRTMRVGAGRVAVTLAASDEPPGSACVVSVPDSHGGAEHRISVLEQGSGQFVARLRKVAKERRKWARREGVSCYRIYDADLPEYAVAIDVYEGAREAKGSTFLHIAEYQPPSSVDPDRARRRLSDVLSLAPVVLGVPPEHAFVKTRMRAKGGAQYRSDERRAYVSHVAESGLVFEVDFSSYLDTGLFLDHRPTRVEIGRIARDARFLNLFAYTGTATVHAAAGGAVSTTTVDLSNTYLAWAKRNMELNGYTGKEHEYVRADVVSWITEARRRGWRFDLVFVDPPTFSNSKSMGARTWDVQRDHVELLIGISRLLSEGGEAVFSCNLRSFKPDVDALARYGVEIEDVTPITVPHDFERNPKVHRCYLVRRA